MGMLGMLALSLSFAACGSNDDPLPDNPGNVDNGGGSDTGGGSTSEASIAKVYILNEGSNNANNAGIAFYAPDGDAESVSDIYYQKNGAKLGDVGQTMIKEGDDIYVAVYGSGYLARLDADCVEQARISFVNDSELSAGIRHIAIEDGVLYASFWGGTVAKIDATSLQVLDKLTGLGDNLEGVAIQDGLLYVCNSCTPDWTEYHTELLVIDLATFTLKEKITVAPNPYSQLVAAEGKLFVISNDYSSATGYIWQEIDPADGNKVSELGNATYITPYNGTLYVIDSQTDWNTYTTVNSFFTYDIRTGTLNEASFLQDTQLASKSIYMLAINEGNGDIYIGTTDYTTNGDIYRYKADGSFVEKFDAGGINPNSAVFFN